MIRCGKISKQQRNLGIKASHWHKHSITYAASSHWPLPLTGSSNSNSSLAVASPHLQGVLCLHIDFPGCGKSFAITGALTIHKRTHNGHKPFKCTFCDRAFTESSNLSKHVRTFPPSPPFLSPPSPLSSLSPLLPLLLLDFFSDEIKFAHAASF